MIKDNFRLIMISAMYENGGNTLQRHLDGHPLLYVYPFESQVGNKKIADYLSSFVPHKYRWPQVQIGQSAEEIYEDIWDEEVKFRVKTPHMSKFKDVVFDLEDLKRKKTFVRYLSKGSVTRARIIEAFFRATFDSWENYNSSGKEKVFVGYNPVQILDGERIIEDFANVKIIHIVRNPYSAYAETKHRPAPLSLERYINTWNVVQLYAISLKSRFPKNVLIVRFEDLIANPKHFFTQLMKDLNLKYDSALLHPSWNAKKLDNMYPWGTIQLPTNEYNLQKIKELSKEEYKSIQASTKHFNEHFNYKEY